MTSVSDTVADSAKVTNKLKLPPFLTLVLRASTSLFITAKMSEDIFLLIPADGLKFASIIWGSIIEPWEAINQCSFVCMNIIKSTTLIKCMLKSMAALDL